MQNGKSYIKVSSDFINKIKSIHSVPRDTVSGKAGVAGLYLRIPYKTGLKTIRQTLEKKETLKTFQLKILLKQPDLF